MINITPQNVSLILYQAIDSLYAFTYTCTDTPMQYIINVLISKGLALERIDRDIIDIVPYLSSIPEESWPSVDDSRHTIYRHLILTLPPYQLHSIFQNLAASVVQEFCQVSMGKYSLVICNAQYLSRIDSGPCLINKTVAEMRLTVRACRPDMCSVGAEKMVKFLRNCLAKMGTSCEISVKASCSTCRQYYIDLTEVNETAAHGDTELLCKRCHGNKLPVSDLLNGFIETRPATELDWRPFHRLQAPGYFVDLVLVR